MSTVIELLRVKLRKVVGDFGIELECEGQGLKFISDVNWATVKDGSLRGSFPSEAAEYVSKLRYVKGAYTSLKVTRNKGHPHISKLFNFYLKDSIIKKSIRASTHVHVNIQHLTHTELCNYIYILILLEDSLLKLSGETRIGNRFCLSSKEAVGFFDGVNVLFKNRLEEVTLSQDQFKYAVINLATIFRYGTVEIRSLEGCSDVVRITRWVNLLVALRELSKKYKNPLHVMEDLQDFKKSKIQDIVKKFPELLGVGVENDILYGISYSCNVPYSFKERVEKPTPETAVNAFERILGKLRLNEDMVL